MNKSLHDTSNYSRGSGSALSCLIRIGWNRLHPECINIPANITTLQQLKPDFPPEIVNDQNNVGIWTDRNWNGPCNELARIAKPTLVIAGTDDNFYVPYGNSLKVRKDSRSLACKIKNAGHAVIDQYPIENGKIMNTFLSTTSSNNWIIH